MMDPSLEGRISWGGKCMLELEAGLYANVDVYIYTLFTLCLHFVYVLDFLLH